MRRHACVMEQFPISLSGTAIRIEGFPDAVKLVALRGPEARRLADLALHRLDLEFAAQCLQAIYSVTPTPPVLRQAFWRSAIIHFCKCFGTGVRFRLQANTIYS